MSNAPTVVNSHLDIGQTWTLLFEVNGEYWFLYFRGNLSLSLSLSLHMCGCVVCQSLVIVSVSVEVK